MFHRIVFVCVLLSQVGCHSITPHSIKHRQFALNWAAPNRWVHVDNIALKDTSFFERVRREWLLTLRNKNITQTDGRPLFWSGDHKGIRTYFTFYPFDDFIDLDVRVQKSLDTQAQVGAQAVAHYNRGDAALIPPHFTQIWAHQPDYDFVSPILGERTESNATHGRIQFQQLNFDRSDRAQDNWKKIKNALVQSTYPLACKTFHSAYGTGVTIRIWFAPNVETLRNAPSLRISIQQQLGEQEGQKLDEEFESIWQTQEEFEITRRDELSHPNL